MRKIIFLILLSAICPSCNMGMLPVYFENRKLDFVPVDILEPAQMTFPAHIQNLVLIYPEIPNKSIHIELIYSDTTDTVHGISEPVVDNLYGSLSENLSLSPRFSMTDTGRIMLPIQNMAWGVYDSLRAQYGSDAIFTLEIFDAKYRFLTSNNYSYEYESYSYIAYLEAEITSIWSIRDPRTRVRHMIQVDHSDYYEGETAPSAKQAFETLPDLKDVFYYDASVVGYKCGEAVSPHWVTAERGIYAQSHRDLRTAKKHIVEENNWNSAREIWESGVKDPNSVLAKHSQFNLVVSEEVVGNIGDAIEKAKLYQLKYKDPHMEQYLEILNKRLENKKLLDEQFHVANNTKSMLQVQRYSGLY